MRIEDGHLTVFDWETSGTLPEYALQPWRIPQRKAWGTSLVWITRIEGKLQEGGGVLASDGLEGGEAGFERARDMAKAMLEEAIANKRVLGGWNVAFDVGVLIGYGLRDLVMKCQFIDGMLLWKHFFLEPEYDADRGNRKSYGLKTFIAENFPELAGYEDDADFHDTSVEARAKLHKYNRRDCLGAYTGIKLLWGALTPQQRQAAIIEAQCIALTAGANTRGLPIDILACGEIGGRMQDIADDCLGKLADDAGVLALAEANPRLIKGKISKTQATEAIVRSPTQMSNLLFDQWGLPVIKENTGKKTKTVTRATDKEVLHELAFVDKRAKTLHIYREALGNRKKFATNILESVAYNEDGCVHPQAIIFGTYSSRLTYASKQGRNKDERPIGFALHQEKRGELFRAALCAPIGYDLVEFDASGQEFRWMAIYSEDDAMLQLCLPGEDPHSFMGAEIDHADYRELIDLVKANDPAAGLVRKLGKLANLSLQYRTSARRLRVKARVDYGLPMELPEAERIHETYLRTYKGVPTYWKHQIALTKKLGYVETKAGRRVQVVGDWKGPLSWSMEGTALNYPIQGTGGEQKYLALAVLRNYLTEIGAYFAWDLHDGLYFFIPKAKTLQALPRMKQMLDHLPYKKAWGFVSPIPLPFDCKVGTSWGNLKDWRG